MVGLIGAVYDATFSAGALPTVLLVAWVVPETRGRSLEEITKLWTPEKPATT
jgi:hypothetical protein